MIRVLVVDDSAFMRKMISDFLTEEKQIEVIGTARNGEEALKKIELLKPDVITLDIEMPVMNGTDTLRKIIEIYQLPVIMVSSQTQQGKECTINCLEIGAFDFITKPSGSISLDLYKIKEQLVERVIEAGRSTQQKAAAPTVIRPEPKPKPIAKPVWSQPKSGPSRHIVCIGTSTGGPRALQKVIPKLPKDLNAPVVVVQHMPEGFTASLADRLNHLSDIHVKEAKDGEAAINGCVYIAPGEKTYPLSKTAAALKSCLIITIHQAVINHQQTTCSVLSANLQTMKK